MYVIYCYTQMISVTIHHKGKAAKSTCNVFYHGIDFAFFHILSPVNCKQKLMGEMIKH